MPPSRSDLLLARVVAGIVLGRWDEVRTAADEQGPPLPPEWREGVLQTHLFAGFPRVIEALELLALAPRTELAGPEAPSPAAAGRALFDRVYAGQAPAVRARLAALDADFAGWVEAHAYGRVLSRPGLSPDRRELLAVVALAAQDQLRQLESHALGALRTGAAPRELREVLCAVSPLLGAERADRAAQVVERAIARSDREP